MSDAPIPRHQFARTELLLGPEGLARLRAARVVVAGLGAVGSYAVEALTRAGVGHLRLVDFDTVQATNLNRQLLALHSTLGQPKAELAAARVRDINPDCQVEAQRVFLHGELSRQLLADRPDVLIDAIDSLGPKVHLLKAALEAGVPCIVSSMGAAMRTDYSAIRIADLATTRHCPLARQVRKRLRRLGVAGPIHCVYSTELVDNAALGEIAEPVDHPRGRDRRPLGSLPTMTGVFGLLAAHHALLWLAHDRQAELPAGESSPCS